MASKRYLVNEEINKDSVIVIGSSGEHLGEMQVREALNLAREEDLDLILVADTGKTPVCKIMDFGKFMYNIQKKEKSNKKPNGELKELRLTVNINEHDIQTKVNNAKKFLSSGNKVRVVVRFRGREIARVEEGKKVLNSFIEKSGGVLERDIKLEGKNLVCILKRQ